MNELFVLDDQNKNKETIRQYARNTGVLLT